LYDTIHFQIRKKRAFEEQKEIQSLRSVLIPSS
jgi:hypothetical protein